MTEEGAKPHSFLRRRRVLIALCGAAIVVKIVLGTVSVLSDDFLYLLQHLVAGWTKIPVPWVLMTGPFYEAWLALPLEHPNLATWIAGTQAPDSASAYLLTAMVKLPIIVADLFCAFLVKSIVESSGRRNGLLAATVWLLNPYVLLAGEMDGSIELIAVALMLAGVLLLMKKRSAAGSVAFGIGIALKLFPIFLIPALLIYYYRLRRVKVLLTLLAISVVGFLVYVYWISAWGVEFGFSLLFYTPFTTTISQLILTPYASKIGLATISVLAFLSVLGAFWTVNESNLFEVAFGSLLAYMAFCDWWPQYLLWLIPLMTVDLAMSRRWTKHNFLLLLASALFLDLILFKFASNISAFYIPTFTNGLEDLSELLRRIYQDSVMIMAFSPILRSIFAGVAVFYSAEICVRNSPRLKVLFGKD